MVSPWMSNGTISDLRARDPRGINIKQRVGITMLLIQG
jgi:hypothetical protein